MRPGLPEVSQRWKALSEVLGPFHGLTMEAIGSRQRGKVRVRQAGAGDAAGILTLLVHADRAIHAVVDDEKDDASVILHGGCEFLTVHQETSVAEAKATTVRAGSVILAAIAAAHAVAHGTIRRSELGAEGAILIEAMRPGGIIA